METMEENAKNTASGSFHLSRGAPLRDVVTRRLSLPLFLLAFEFVTLLDAKNFESSGALLLLLIL